MSKFSKIEDLKQLKTNDELVKKSHEIVDSLKGFTKAEKFRILTTLMDTFIAVCESEGISFLELKHSVKK